MGDFPVIKFVILFTLGILIHHLINLTNQVYQCLIISTISLVALFYFVKIKSPRIINNVLFGLLILSIGGYFYQLKNLDNIKYPFNSPKIRNAEVSGQILNIDLIKKGKVSLVIKLDSIKNETTESSLKYKFLLNIWKDTTNTLDTIYNELEVGNKISFVGTISRAKNQRNPGEFDYEKYLQSINIIGVISCYKLESLKIDDNQRFFITNQIFKLRKRIDERIKELHNENAASLLKGILLADRSDINYDVKDSFVNSGVIHVLAVSGLHVGFISGIFFLILGRFDIRIKYLLTIFGILLFLILTGGHASVFRASTMAIVYLIAKLSSRSTNGFNSIAIAALILLLLNPNDLFSPGFLLSFSAVISILIIFPIISKTIEEFSVNKYFKKVLLFVAVSLSAQLGTLPFTLTYFNKLSVVSLFANLIVIPLIGIIVAIGILTLSLSLLSIWAASIFASANEFLIGSLFIFVKQTSNLSFSFIPIYNFSIVDGIIFYIILGIIFFVLKTFNKRILSSFIIFLLLFSMFNLLKLDDKDLLPNGLFSAVFIDIGQGDSFLIKFPNGSTALIDAGNATEYFDNGERVIYPLLQRLGIDTIDYAFISHLDSDHYAGSISLINKNIIKKVYKPKDKKSVKDSIFEDYLSFNKIEYSYYSNNSFEIDGCKIYTLNDTSNYSFNNFDSNNKSGIIKFVYGNNSFLFVGDAEHEAEEYLMSRYGEFLKSDVLKVGHHGSKTSTSDSFLDLVNPKIGIISAGLMNKFKHPSKSVIEKLNDKNIKVRRTDYEGAVILTSNGESINSIDWRNF